MVFENFGRIIFENKGEKMKYSKKMRRICDENRKNLIKRKIKKDLRKFCWLCEKQNEISQYHQNIFKLVQPIRGG